MQNKIVTTPVNETLTWYYKNKGKKQVLPYNKIAESEYFEDALFGFVSLEQLNI